MHITPGLIEVGRYLSDACSMIKNDLSSRYLYQFLNDNKIL